MANLAIKGHRIQGDKVIKLLEILGGKNNHHYLGINDSWVYYINKEGCITLDFDVSKFSVFTLEEFLEKYPYKVGDKVIYNYDKKTYFIRKMYWEKDNILYQLSDETYTDDSSMPDVLIFDVDIAKLQPYKEETMGKEISGAIIDRFICLEGYDFYDDKGNIIDTKEITMKKKKPEYPKTYKECCEVLLLNSEKATWGIEGLEYKRHLIVCFQRLLICRDAYWKIAGEWTPDWLYDDAKYVLMFNSCEICKDAVKHTSYVLAFPTEEMRDAFYENFKKLIEECKELL